MTRESEKEKDRLDQRLSLEGSQESSKGVHEEGG